MIVVIYINASIQAEIRLFYQYDSLYSHRPVILLIVPLWFLCIMCYLARVVCMCSTCLTTSQVEYPFLSLDSVKSCLLDGVLVSLKDCLHEWCWQCVIELRFFFRLL